jgi:hypothetical protein
MGCVCSGGVRPMKPGPPLSPRPSHTPPPRSPASERPALFAGRGNGHPSTHSAPSEPGAPLALLFFARGVPGGGGAVGRFPARCPATNGRAWCASAASVRRERSERRARAQRGSGAVAGRCWRAWCASAASVRRERSERRARAQRGSGAVAGRCCCCYRVVDMASVGRCAGRVVGMPHTSYPAPLQVPQNTPKTPQNHPPSMPLSP